MYNRNVELLNNREPARLRKRSGVLTPLFSVYSRESFGIGDFKDLKLLVDWCVKTGNSIIQLLPMNEVGNNFSPYESISSFALEPMYAAVGRGRRAVSGGHVDYRIKNEKLELLQDMYLNAGKKRQGEVDEFREQNRWIEDFAAFKVLKRLFEGKPWYLWPDAWRNRSGADIDALYSEHRDELEFEIWLQSLLYRQFRDARSYAAEKGVFLMGDLPVVVNRDSADVWAHPEFFKMSLAAGAPPDVFSAKGQRWGNPGMPTYDWEKIASDGYGYINEKMRCASGFYDILRLDHVVGLFRIWSIPLEEPLNNEGMNGFFDPPDENAWEEHGRKILSAMINSAGIFLCGEDLGVIPPVCRLTMETLGIPGIDVQRWMKDWQGTQEFLPPEKYRNLSISVLSTHDTSNWNAWWEQESSDGERKDFWKHLGIGGPMREKASPAVTESALRFILEARSIFSIQLIFDWLNVSGDILRGRQSGFRINTPGTVSGENWSAVLPLPLEDLLVHGVSDKIRSLIHASSRTPS